MRPGGGVVGGRCVHRASLPACLANGARFLAVRPGGGVVGGRCVHRATERVNDFDTAGVGI